MPSTPPPTPGSVTTHRAAWAALPLGGHTDLKWSVEGVA